MSVRTASLLPLAAFAIAAATAAQGRNGLIAFSQPEFTLSGSGGTSLQQLRPNETAVLAWGTTAACAGLSAEKWAPRAVYSTMAGDDNADGLINNATLFGSVDALVATVAPNPIGWQNQRSVFWSVSAPMGNAVSASPFRPGDVARIVRDAGGMDGQVEYFMTREQFNTALAFAVRLPAHGTWVPLTPCYVSAAPPAPLARRRRFLVPLRTSAFRSRSPQQSTLL